MITLHRDQWCSCVPLGTTRCSVTPSHATRVSHGVLLVVGLTLIVRLWADTSSLLSVNPNTEHNYSVLFI